MEREIWSNLSHEHGNVQRHEGWIHSPEKKFILDTLRSVAKLTVIPLLTRNTGEEHCMPEEDEVNTLLYNLYVVNWNRALMLPLVGAFFRETNGSLHHSVSMA